MGRLNLMDVRWEKIPLLWSTVKERRLTKGFSISMGGGGGGVQSIHVSAEE